MSNKDGEALKPLVDNYRPPQPLYSRVVTTNIKAQSGGHGGGSTHTGLWNVLSDNTMHTGQILLPNYYNWHFNIFFSIMMLCLILQNFLCSALGL